jgi:uncharacterized protein DUF5681
MTRPRRSRGLDNGPKGDYAVGYGRAPISGRWKPGQSGNPKSRKKASKTVGQSIDETLMRKMTIVEDGRRVTLTLQDFIFLNLGYAAARRDIKAALALFALKGRYQDSNETILNPAELDPNDKAIIEGYLEKLQSASTASGPQTPTEKKPDEEEVRGGDSKPDRDSSDGESP